MTLTSKSLALMSDSQIIGIIQGWAFDGTMPSPGLTTRIRIQLEKRQITYDDFPHLAMEQADPKELPEPTSLNYRVRLALHHAKDSERKGLPPWKIATSPHDHLDGETMLDQEWSQAFEDYVLYGDLCIGCRDPLPFPCLEEMAGGDRCVPVPMTRCLALLLLEDDHPDWYRAWLVKGEECSFEHAAELLQCSVWTVRMRLKGAKEYLAKRFCT